MILFILASGLTITLGLMGYFNLAHGVLYMFAGFIGFSVFDWSGSFLLALLASTITAGLIGLAIERGFLQHLGGEINNQALITIGFLFILENLALWIWGPIPRDPLTAISLGGTIEVPFTGGRLPIYRLVVIFIGLAIAMGLWWFDKTRLGALIRAGMDDSQMLRGMGINLPKIQIGVFAGASALAGCAAIIAGPLLGMNLQTSFDILILALVVTVVGGAGSILGAFIFSLAIGLVSTFGKVLFPEVAMFIIYASMVIVLVFKPAGLLGRELGK